MCSKNVAKNFLKYCQTAKISVCLQEINVAENNGPDFGSEA